MTPATPAFRTYATVALTSTTTSQNIQMPSGQSNQALCAYNAAANIVYLAIGTTSSIIVAEPSSFAAGVGFISVPPGGTFSFGADCDGKWLAYIAVTAGGKLVLSVGDGF